MIGTAKTVRIAAFVAMCGASALPVLAASLPQQVSANIYGGRVKETCMVRGIGEIFCGRRAEFESLQKNRCSAWTSFLDMGCLFRKPVEIVTRRSRYLELREGEPVVIVFGEDSASGFPETGTSVRGFLEKSPDGRMSFAPAEACSPSGQPVPLKVSFETRKWKAALFTGSNAAALVPDGAAVEVRAEPSDADTTHGSTPRCVLDARTWLDRQGRGPPTYR